MKFKVYRNYLNPDEVVIDGNNISLDFIMQKDYKGQYIIDFLKNEILVYIVDADGDRTILDQVFIGQI